MRVIQLVEMGISAPLTAASGACLLAFCLKKNVPPPLLVAATGKKCQLVYLQQFWSR
jgi:hypothetical protein